MKHLNFQPSARTTISSALRIVALALCGIFGLSPALGAANIDVESHQYIETIGENTQNIKWCVEKSDTTRMLWQNETEFSVIESEGPYNAVSWRGINPSEGTSITVERKGDAIVIAGTLKGKPADKSIPIDEAPWFQSLSWSLRSLVLSDQPKLEFWTLRPDTLKEYKMVANKVGEEQMQINGETVTAVKLDVRLKGMLSAFWHSTYWYRKSDGVWLRYEGPSGGPGKPMIIIEYQKTNPTCTIAQTISSADQVDDRAQGAHRQTRN